MIFGLPENPVTYIVRSSRATCQLRYVVGTEVDDILPALRNHLNAHGLNYIEICCDDQVRFATSRQDADKI